jgi:hypothetical protein
MELQCLKSVVFMGSLSGCSQMSITQSTDATSTKGSVHKTLQIPAAVPDRVLGDAG